MKKYFIFKRFPFFISNRINIIDITHTNQSTLKDFVVFKKAKDPDMKKTEN